MGDALELGAHIKALRSQLGLTQEKLAARIERSVDAVSKIERGASLPSLETLIGIARVLDVPLERIIAPLQIETQKALPRIELEGQLLGLASSLSDQQLRVAVNQIRALSEGSR